MQNDFLMLEKLLLANSEREWKGAHWGGQQFPEYSPISPAVYLGADGGHGPQVSPAVPQRFVRGRMNEMSLHHLTFAPPHSALRAVF